MLADLPFLNSRRLKLYASGAAISLAILFFQGLAILYSQGGYVDGGDQIGADYSSFWAASRQILAGKAAEVYIPALHLAAEQPYLRTGYEAYFYPPTYMIFCAPLALLPFFASYAVFELVTAAVCATLFAIVIGCCDFIWLLFCFCPFYFNILAGQNAFVTAAILGFGLEALPRRPRLAGALLGLMVIKPHLALALPIALIAAQRWRALLWAGLSASGLCLMSWVAFGTPTWLGFLRNSAAAREALELGTVDYSKMESLFAAARQLGASVPAAYALQGALALGVAGGLVWALRQRPGADTERALTVIACLLLSPFVLTYDMAIALAPVAWMVRAWRAGGFPAGSRLALGLVYLAPLVFGLSVIFGVRGLNAFPFGLPMLLPFGGFLLWRAANAGGPAPRADRAPGLQKRQT